MGKEVNWGSTERNMSQAWRTSSPGNLCAESIKSELREAKQCLQAFSFFKVLPSEKKKKKQYARNKNCKSNYTKLRDTLKIKHMKVINLNIKTEVKSWIEFLKRLWCSFWLMSAHILFWSIATLTEKLTT